MWLVIVVLCSKFQSFCFWWCSLYSNDMCSEGIGCGSCRI